MRTESQARLPPTLTRSRWVLRRLGERGRERGGH
ncbi:uncharacterized protein METZ01_LOCUS409131 [marine metagenome]|uniref:Uncharacterized protein n=1 Tax=marine metagenome TaxID=408172 RepID=A0A382WBN8_9ZZZZ